jgi:tetratricopeptide (TPR) repeat protein
VYEKTGITVFSVSASVPGNSLRELGDKFSGELAGKFIKYAKISGTEFKGPPGEYSAKDWYYKGRFYVKKNDFRRAEQAFKAAIKAAPHTFLYIRELGNLYQNQRMFGKALEIYAEMDKAATLSGRKPEDVAKVYNDYGTLYYEEGDREKAEHYFDLLLGLIKNNALDSMEVAADMANISTLYIAKKDYDKGISILERSLWTAERKRADAEAASFAMNLAIAYRDRGSPDRADEYFSKAIALAQKKGEGAGMVSDFLKEKGIVKKNAGKFGQAMQYFLKALGISRNEGDDRRIEGLYQLMGLTSLSAGALPEAVDYLNKAVSLSGSAADEEETAQAYYGIGAAKMNLGDMRTGIEMMVKAVGIERKHKNYQDTHLMLLGLHKAYVLTGDRSKALGALKEAANTAEKYSAEEAASDMAMIAKMDTE